MFEHALDSSWAIRSRHGLTTLTSITLQVLAVAALLALPLLRPTGLPSFHQTSTPISFGQPMEAPPTPRTSSSPHRNVPNIAADIDIPFRTPWRIPRGIQDEGEDRPPQIGGAEAAIPGAGGGNPGGIANLFESGSRPVLPEAQPASTGVPLRLSRMSEGNLIRKVKQWRYRPYILNNEPVEVETQITVNFSLAGN